VLYIFGNREPQRDLVKAFDTIITAPSIHRFLKDNGNLMRKTAFLLLIIFAIAQKGIGAMNIDSSLQNLKDDLRTERIEKLRIISVPYGLLTIAALTPETLPTSATIDWVIEIDKKMRGSLLTALDKTRIKELNSVPDLRWGLIFYDKNGKQLHSLYLNGKVFFQSGRRGILDGNLVRLNDELFRWCESTLKELKASDYENRKAG
jgi:hypothetical protein